MAGCWTASWSAVSRRAASSLSRVLALEAFGLDVEGVIDDLAMEIQSVAKFQGSCCRACFQWIPAVKTLWSNRSTIVRPCSAITVAVSQTISHWASQPLKSLLPKTVKTGGEGRNRTIEAA